MAQKLKKKYIENDAVDGSKLKLLEDQAVRAVNSSGDEIDLIKLRADGRVLINGEIAVIKPDLDEEKLIRENADNNLQSQINNIVSNVDPAAIDSLTEILNAFQAGDTNINNSLAALSSGSSSALNQEILDRQLAINSLQSQLDAALTRVSSLESVVWHKVKLPIDEIVMANSYIDLSHLVVEGSIAVSVDRLMMHEGEFEDYTVSTVEGVSRITFTGAPLDAGDNLYIKYQYKA